MVDQSLVVGLVSIGGIKMIKSGHWRVNFHFPLNGTFFCLSRMRTFSSFNYSGFGPENRIRSANLFSGFSRGYCFGRGVK